MSFPIFYKILKYASFVSVTFLILSAFGFVFTTRQTIEAYGWEYEQTVIIEGREEVKTIRVMDQVIFGAVMFWVALTQAIQYLIADKVINEKIN